MILTRKVGQSAWSAFGVLSGFISRSVFARLQVSMCSGYDFSTLVNIQTHIGYTHIHTDSILTSLYGKLR